MHTPSVHRRVVLGGLTVFCVLVLAMGVFVYTSSRAQLDQTLAEVLQNRADVARELGDEPGTDAEQLATRLQSLGIPAVVTTPDGDRIAAEPALPRFQQGPPGVGAGAPRIAQEVELADGTSVEVFATRAGVEATLQGLLARLALGGVLGLIAAGLLFRHAARRATEPLEQVVAAAGRTAAGHHDERLRADDPTTELGRLAEAYDQMLDVLEAAVERAQHNEELTRRFLADAAHQLRTPITALRASVESLLGEDRPQVRDELMMHLVRETARARGVLESLLHLARLDEGAPPARTATDLTAIVTDEVDRARSLAPHLTIALDAGTVEQEEVDVDARLVRDALGNLLDNARRHARSRIQVTLSDGQDVVEVAIVDDGTGIADDSRELVFDRFTTLDGHGGSGLGLPVARSIARSHGGDLHYDGSAFRLRVPRRAATNGTV